MKELLFQVRFAQPHFLLLLAFVPLLWTLWRRHRLIVILWRVAVLLLLILGLAEPEHMQQDEKKGVQPHRIFALDLSRSISPGFRRWMHQRMRENPPTAPEDRILVFAGKTRGSRGLEGLVGRSGF